MKPTDLITTARETFYPTPPALADRLMQGINWDLVSSVLEPSAGNGNLVRRAASAHNAASHRNYGQLDIDCVELDPALRAVLSFEFGGKKEAELRGQLDVIKEKCAYNNVLHRAPELSAADKIKKRTLELALDALEHAAVHVVHDDFLTFNTCKRYGAIIMNPPFSDGDRHLTKAIELLRRDGGYIRCLLNAETLLNPYTNLRKSLTHQLDELGATIEFVDGAFSDAERKTDVRVAIVSVDIPVSVEKSVIFERLRKAEAVNIPPVEGITDLAVADFLQHIVAQYNVEVAAGVALMREYAAMRPNLFDCFSVGGICRPTITLIVGDTDSSYGGNVPDANKYVRLVRLKYWKELYSSKDFVGKLTSNLRKKYAAMVESMADYDFTLFNIKRIMAEMNAGIVTGVQETILALFDRLSGDHAWYPETKKNIHYFNGWKTNQVHKVNGKVILPTHGMFSDYSWSKTFEVREAESTISDIEKVFNYLDGHMTEDVDLHGVLARACEGGQTKNIPCKFFDVTLYKKGTMHIKFRNQDLLDRFNIYVARNKNWLPPCYGKKAYSDMNCEEKTVVDQFQGAAAYERVLERRGYFLAEPTRNVLAITDGSGAGRQ